MKRSLLQYFASLYEAGNITKAAESMFISRQSFSGYIASLEKEVGTPLFVRSREGVTPTDAGKILAEFVERESARLRDSEIDLNATLQRIASNECLEKIKLALPLCMFPEGAIEKILATYRAGVDYSLELHDEFEPSIADVRRGKYDVVITRNIPLKKIDGLASKLFIAQKTSFLVRANSPLAKCDAIDFENDISGMHLLCTHAYVQKDLEFLAKIKGFSLRLVPVSYAVIRHEIVSARNAICALPEMTARKMLTMHSDLTCIAAVNFPLSASAHIVYRENPPSYIRSFLDDMERVSTEHFGAPPESVF